MRALKEQVINNLDSDWTVGHDGVLRCPCNHRVEDDGQCPNGHVSPLRKAGMI